MYFGPIFSEEGIPKTTHNGTIDFDNEYWGYKIMLGQGLSDDIDAGDG